jgi:hypothetical protein
VLLLFQAAARYGIMLLPGTVTAAARRNMFFKQVAANTISQALPDRLVGGVNDALAACTLVALLDAARGKWSVQAWQ